MWNSFLVSGKAQCDQSAFNVETQHSEYLICLFDKRFSCISSLTMSFRLCANQRPVFLALAHNSCYFSKPKLLSSFTFWCPICCSICSPEPLALNLYFEKEKCKKLVCCFVIQYLQYLLRGDSVSRMFGGNFAFLLNLGAFREHFKRANVRPSSYSTSDCFLAHRPNVPRLFRSVLKVNS